MSGLSPHFFTNFYRTLLAIMFLAYSFLGFAQVRTVVTNGLPVAEIIPLHLEQLVIPHDLPKPDVNAVLLEDSLLGRQIFRFGVKIPVEMTKETGELTLNGAFVNWKTAVRSEGATSLNFQFRGVALPEHAEMYIYNHDQSMVIGPITQSDVFEGRFNSDIVRGEEAIVEVIMPRRNFTAFSLGAAAI